MPILVKSHIQKLDATFQKEEKILNYFLKEYFVVPAVHDPPFVVDQEGAVGDLLPKTWI